MTKYVLVKGRFGMGGRIAVMLSAWHYARETGRELVVDWNDFSYYEPGTEDVFRALFERPVVSDTPVDALDGLSTFPSLWDGLIPAFRNEDAGNVMPYAMSARTPPPPGHPSAEDADVVVVTRNLPVGDIDHLYAELRLTAPLRDRVEELSEKFAPQDRIGVQIRHGNGERLVTPPDNAWFFDQIDNDPGSAQLLVASDSIGVVQEFEQRYDDVVHSPKWYPSADSGSMHQNAACPDRLENATEALVDMWLLSQCRRLLVCSGFFGETAKRLAGPKTPFTRYPGKIHASPEEKRAAGWTNPI